LALKLQGKEYKKVTIKKRGRTFPVEKEVRVSPGSKEKEGITEDTAAGTPNPRPHRHNDWNRLCKDGRTKRTQKGNGILVAFF